MNVARTIVAGIIGGTISKLVGGKFANGAATAAFAQAFNGNSFWDKAQEYGQLALEFAPGYDLAMCMGASASCSAAEWAMAMADFTPLAGIAKARKAYKIVENSARGRASEARVLNDLGLTKNTKKVSTAEGNSIPDALTDTLSVEVKDAQSVSLTRQLRIQTEAARASGRQSILVTGKNTCVSGTCQRAFDQIIRRSDLGPK